MMPARRTKIYPNAWGEWKGCPETCPDDCPFPDCTMPPELCARMQKPICHGWVMTEEGVTEEIVRPKKCV